LLTGFTVLRFTTGRRMHTHFVDESSCLTADNVRNIVVNNSQITDVEYAVFLHADVLICPPKLMYKNIRNFLAHIFFHLLL
jgi:hypothetical protein